MHIAQRCRRRAAVDALSRKRQGVLSLLAPAGGSFEELTLPGRVSAGPAPGGHPGQFSSWRPQRLGRSLAPRASPALEVFIAEAAEHRYSRPWCHRESRSIDIATATWIAHPPQMESLFRLTVPRTNPAITEPRASGRGLPKWIIA
ncbi:uncharacterized protein SOCE26_065570 [Sorangium cellulosum]|uniref:Uncharacterized protein n=1 Tax=Sorangium cellulosum TaxID=56 RepID=A0A2L0F0M5_SORCE|nr:uncharacterized protein SOCE26_065570 [Sorangium cellulosum]